MILNIHLDTSGTEGVGENQVLFIKGRSTQTDVSRRQHDKRRQQRQLDQIEQVKNAQYTNLPRGVCHFVLKLVLFVLCRTCPILAKAPRHTAYLNITRRYVRRKAAVYTRLGRLASAPGSTYYMAVTSQLPQPRCSVGYLVIDNEPCAWLRLRFFAWNGCLLVVRSYLNKGLTYYFSS